MTILYRIRKFEELNFEGSNFRGFKDSKTSISKKACRFITAQ